MANDAIAKLLESICLEVQEMEASANLDFN